jgi:CAAX protease family protein
MQWTPVIYGPYGEAWPLQSQSSAPFVPKGPGIKGGGIAAIGAGVGSVGSIAVLIAFIATSHGHVDLSNPWFLLVSQLALWVGFLGAVVFASRKNGSSSLRADYGLSKVKGRDLWMGMSGGALARVVPLVMLVVFVLTGPGFGTPNSASPRILGVTPTGPMAWLIVFLLAVVGAPVIEELFFRGLLQGAFTRRLGPTPAIFVTAVIFCFAHVLSEGPTAPEVLFPAALILGYLRHRTGRLAAGMVAHATFNATLFALFLVPAFR